jgi:hypothetical protein
MAFLQSGYVDARTEGDGRCLETNGIAMDSTCSLRNRGMNFKPAAKYSYSDSPHGFNPVTTTTSVVHAQEPTEKQSFLALVRDCVLFLVDLEIAIDQQYVADLRAQSQVIMLRFSAFTINDFIHSSLTIYRISFKFTAFVVKDLFFTVFKNLRRRRLMLLLPRHQKPVYHHVLPVTGIE